MYTQIVMKKDAICALEQLVLLNLFLNFFVSIYIFTP